MLLLLLILALASRLDYTACSVHVQLQSGVMAQDAMKDLQTGKPIPLMMGEQCKF